MPSQLLLCGVCSAWVVESVAGNHYRAHLGKICSRRPADERRILHSDLKRPLVAMYGHSSLPLMVLGTAVMGFAELFIDPRYVADYAH